ncbi:hypothetical protein F4815DRAFT_449142 [Daldinia loculata]|nr:hypothetical protein F4815DRAFT_449142 [Daldinia loculata]
MVDRVPELVRVNIASMTDRIGIPLLAQRIALGPDYEAFIFRKFDQLSARNLLHLESRLGYLEYKLDQADRQAEHGLDNETRRSIRAWEAFEENAKDKDQEALLRQNQIAALEGPRKRALDVVCDQSYINVYDSFGNKSSRRPILAGLSEKRLSEHNHRDLAALRRTPDKDLLSRFLQDHWMFKTTKITDGAEHINENHVAQATATISTIVAAILLLGAIVLLRLLTQKNAQLGVIGALCSQCWSLDECTKGRDIRLNGCFQFAPIIANLDPSHKFVYVDGLVQCKAAKGIEGIFQLPFYCYHGMPTPSDLQAAFDYICQVIEDEGPFNGVIGFSQGAALAASLLLRR